MTYGQHVVHVYQDKAVIMESIASSFWHHPKVGISSARLVSQMMHTVRHVIAKVKSKYWQRTHKFGIRIPKPIKEALRVDAENGNTLWWDAIVLEMSNVRVAFEEYDGELTQDGKPKGYKL
jgi:hypothetical protein